MYLLLLLGVLGRVPSPPDPAGGLAEWCPREREKLISVRMAGSGGREGARVGREVLKRRGVEKEIQIRRTNEQELKSKASLIQPHTGEVSRKQA
jgi:hypothetical protein